MKISNEKLFNILSEIENTYIYEWNMVRKIHALIKAKKAFYSGLKWEDSWKNRPKLPLEEIEAWSTYDKTCISLKFYVEKQELMCHALIYNGESFNGVRKCKRFETKISLPLYFIENLKEYILSEFDKMAERAYFTHLETQKKLWIKHYKNMIL